MHFLSIHCAVFWSFSFLNLVLRLCVYPRNYAFCIERLLSDQSTSFYREKYKIFSSAVLNSKDVQKVFLFLKIHRDKDVEKIILC